MLDQNLAAMLQKYHAGPALEGMDANEQRQFFRALRSAPTPIPGVESRDFRIEIGDTRLDARLLSPARSAADTDDLPCLVYFHGGGWMVGGLDTHDQSGRRLALGAGIKVLLVAYRLAPEHRFPAAHDDALASTSWLFDHARQLGVDPKRIAVGGESAGANMAAFVASELRDEPSKQCALQLLFYPMTQVDIDTASRSEFAEGHLITIGLHRNCMQNYLELDSQRTDPRISILLRKDLRRSPPAFIAVGGNDMFRDEARMYADRLTNADVPVEYHEYASLIHGFCGFFDLAAEVRKAFDDASQALRRACRRD
ncbi:TPA: alpha/beta hydrolase [Burkholderia cenocepacia]|uniref:alpha/beta hydrolase n=1 Tax=unclassified Burkholderia TaxID=2613784 RepID=UPI001589BC6E|nr:MULTISPECIES: alpha/beta hydrolase [unclassified Burkholderia]HEF5873869.1 alpha/beta hydrolase [Burkholderia cenocepacia]